MRTKSFVLLLLLTTACQLQPNDNLNENNELHGYILEEGFDLEVIASEPLLDAPVAIDFDTKGRIWVTEMNSYMKNVHGSGMEDPTGRILILEDKDGDGIIDTSKKFLTGLVLPRAIALVYGGLLYAEPPNLWFVEIENDKPGKRVLVDSIYAATGNPEHQPNGLLLNIDNWIYNAKSHFRYRRKNGVWEKEPTSFRGQWGISKDNTGRLYYNTNSQQLIGDYVLPNLLIRNQYYKPKQGINKQLTDDQRVYPLHATSVNRGYITGILNDDSLLVNATAACGPQVYRGDMFPADYQENVFVCLPEANVIKRNILTYNGDNTKAKQAWEGKEFLASLDEGFRPVSLSNGPDGNLYVVDMHRGLIGHYAYLSPYLKEKIRLKKLDSIMDMGRILRISVGKEKFAQIPDMNKLSGDQLVDLLKSKNGWIRDKAQHLIVHKNLPNVSRRLEETALDESNPFAQIHALYALQGLDKLSIEHLKTIALQNNSSVVIHAIKLLNEFVSDQETTAIADLFKVLKQRNNVEIDLYMSFSIGPWAELSHTLFFPIVLELEKQYRGNALFEEALISGFSENFESLLSATQQALTIDSVGFIEMLHKTIDNQQSNEINPIFLNKILREDGRTTGWKMFNTICATCHGPEGSGIDGLAPPLMNSEHIAQSKVRLALIILHGLKGPVHVKGELYDNLQTMPGFGNNESLTDKDIANIIAYVTNAFSNNPKGISSEKIKELRKLKPASGAEYTEAELLEIPIEEEKALNFR